MQVWVIVLIVASFACVCSTTAAFMLLIKYVEAVGKLETEVEYWQNKCEEMLQAMSADALRMLNEKTERGE